MEIATIFNEEIAIILPKGRIDSDTSVDFDEQISNLIAKGLLKFVVDFSETDFISSSGLRVLLMKAKQIKNRGGRIVLTSMPASIDEVFEVSGFSIIFCVYNMLEEAIKDLRNFS